MKVLPNHIYQMDILEGIKYLPDKSIKTIIADPPYFLGMTHNGQKGSFVDLAICAPFFSQLFAQFKRVLQDDGEVFFFCDFRSYAFFYPIFNSVLKQKNLIVWDKGNMAGNHYNFSHEFIIFGTKEGCNINRGGSNVWKKRRV
ncbi:site-specific DNA-methyltransferase (adenine-specific) [Flexibacter flexilis DSM 6793]|uniref:site-specific DNA-methyltransferase (adenine-specific) n=2 Tax=Flexibacter flexilis TaxID=998 RepID=A0A1I1MYU0_9BACT|nr:site-specific DNA-methyltransferase (adenine-specific) [Flexibacter flexilis DSM 6793]